LTAEFSDITIHPIFADKDFNKCTSEMGMLRFMLRTAAAIFLFINVTTAKIQKYFDNAVVAGRFFEIKIEKYIQTPIASSFLLAKKNEAIRESLSGLLLQHNVGTRRYRL